MNDPENGLVTEQTYMYSATQMKVNMCSLEVSMRSELKVTRTFCNSRWAIEKGGEKEYANSLFHAIFSVKSESALLENVARCSFNTTDGGSVFFYFMLFLPSFILLLDFACHNSAIMPRKTNQSDLNFI